MDLNQLYFDHQLLMIRAERTASCVSRRECEADASQVAGRIGRIQRKLGAGAAPSWEELATVARHSSAAPLRHLQGHAA